EGARANVVKGAQLGGEDGEILIRTVADGNTGGDGIAEGDARLVRDTDCLRELVHDLRGVGFAPARAVLAVILRAIEIEVVAVLTEEADEIVAFRRGIKRAVEAFDNP